MNYKIDAYLGSNITILLDNLDLSKVSRDELRSLYDQIGMMDTPDLLVVLHPSGFTIQFAERRIIVGDQRQSPISQMDLWTPALKAFSLIRDNKLIAYGFNYILGLLMDEHESVQDYLTRAFLPQSAQLAEKLEIESLSTFPRLIYSRGQTRYDIRMEPSDSNRFILHLNAHFNTQALPDLELLKSSFISEVEEVNRLLGII
jgi:hypothetical protein